MPTYEYRCRDCAREFEVFQRMSDEPVAPCPGCGRGAERLISGGAGLLFKGEGFYITDYRPESYREQARQESGAAPQQAEASGTKNEGGRENAAKNDGKGPGGASADGAEKLPGDSARASPDAGGGPGD